MGKKTQTAAPSSSAPQTAVAAPGDFAALKEEGNRAFAVKEYEKAMASWDKALSLISSTEADAAILYNNKAACHLMNKRYKEAVADCTAALECKADYFKALTRRAKAYEQLGQYKQALADLTKANQLDGASDESKSAEKRVRDLAAGKKPAGLGSNGLARKNVAAKPQAGRQVTFPCKMSFGDDVRSFHLPPETTYLQLVQTARSLFPGANPFVVKYVDKEGDLITVASQADIQRAMQEVAEVAIRSSGGKTMNPGQLPAIRLQVVKVASESEVPSMPKDEMQYFQKMMEELQRTQSAKPGIQDQQAQPQVQIDDWILHFVELFKEHCGIDPDKPLEPQEVGSEKLHAGFQAMINDDPKAMELLEEAYGKFEEQVCQGMLNQAQVHQCRGDRFIFKAAADGTPAAKILASVEEHYKKAEAKVEECLAYKPTYYDAFMVKSGLEQSRAKLAANYLAEPVKPIEEIEDPTERQAAEEAANKAAISKAFERVTKESAAAADACMDKAYAFIQQAIDSLPEADKNKELKPLKPMAEQIPGDPESETPLKASLVISLGNAYYEHSLIRAAGGLDWKSLVEKSQALFKEAGAADSDIRAALKGHPLAEEMADLIGPEPVAAPAVSDKTEAPKGLPALAPKPKKK